MSNLEDHERDISGDNLPSISDSNMFLSPDQAQVSFEVESNVGTPTRVLSSHSLAGEDFILSHRPSFEFPTDGIALSPFTPSEGTQTPPLSLPDPVTPPPLNPSVSSSIARIPSQPYANSTGGGSLSGRMRPPRVPQVYLQPTRGASSRHGRSASEFSVLSALTDGTNDNRSHVSPFNVSSNISVPRRRTASWDFHETSNRARQRSTDSPGSLANISTQSTPANLLQPILQEDFGAPPSSIITGASASLRVGNTLSRSSSQNPKGDETMAVSSNTASTSSSGSQQPMAKRGETFATIIKNGSVESPRPQASAVWNPSSQQETGSFVAISDHSGGDSQSRTPPYGNPTGVRPTRVGNAVRALERKHYSVDEVMEAYPKETTEEALLMSKIESQRLTLDPDSIAPDVPPEILADPAQTGRGPVKEEKRTRALGASYKTESRKNYSFGDLARNLLEASHGFTMDEAGQRPSPASQTSMRHVGDTMYEGAETSFGHHTVEKDEELAGDDVRSSGESNRLKKEGTRRHQILSRFYSFRQVARGDFVYFAQFLGSHWSSIQQDVTRILRWIMLPCLGVAALLFYVFDNPLVQSNDEAESYQGGGVDATGDGVANNGLTTPASISWWLLFVGVRQCITLELARFSQLIIIDFFMLRTRLVPNLLGSSLSLVVVQSKGWPFVLLLWALWDFALLYGDRRFVHHWAYWQDLLEMMNSRNPSGDVTSQKQYLRVLVSAVFFSIAGAAKRFVMGQIVGKRAVHNYREDLGRLMRKLILMCEVSHLSLRVPDKNGQKINKFWPTGVDYAVNHEPISLELGLAPHDDGSDSAQQMDSFDYSDAQSAHSKDTRRLFASERLEIMELLEEWEEPELQSGEEEAITMGIILQFRRAVEFVSGEYPFSVSFGAVRTRKDCVTSAQMLFERLMGDAPGSFLDFETLCLIARDRKGEIDRATVKDMIQVFRPNRNGQLSKLDFVKSVDSVYKSLRLLLAAIQNSQEIDRAYTSIVNLGFYACLSLIVMVILGVDIQVLIIGLASIVVSFAFMIGPASSKAVEGILFVLLRRPYDIGDRINIGEPASRSDSCGGDSSWVVEKVDLYTTTARLGTTREMATFSNGSLANMRIMNLNRSDKPNVFLNLKFSMDTTLEQRQAFKRRIATFIKERPRQWSKVVDFRSKRVETDLGYVEYTLILQHRERWQNVSAILASRGEVFNHAVELQKELNMKYSAPHVPVDIHQFRSAERSTSHMSYLDEPKKDR